MCGIIGAEKSFPLVFKFLNKIKHRGRDLQRCLKTEYFNLCFALHSTVDFVPQPFFDNDKFAALNCEIYNWKELKEKYKVEAKNDAELGAKLLFSEGIGIIKEFEGPFAGIFYDGEFLYLFRDPIGRFPMFYRNKPFVFSSERLYIGDIELFPRKIVKYDPKTKKLEEIDFWDFDEIIKGENYDFFNELKKAIKKREHKKGFILFSGGIDSTVIAYFSNLPLITVGYKNNKDKTTTEKIADILGKERIYFEIKEREIKESLKKIVDKIGRDPVKVEVALITYFASKYAREEYGFKVGISGSGADELFYGYSRMHRSVEKETYWALRNIYERNLYRDNVAGFLGGVEIRTPYLDENVIKASFYLDEKLRYRKQILINFLKEKLGIENWKKTAAQYSSNINKWFGKIPSKKIMEISNKRDKKIGALISGGKDSWFSLYIVEKRGYLPSVLINFVPEKEDSWMFHYPLAEIAYMQAKLSNYDVVKLKSSGNDEDAEKELEIAMKFMKEKKAEAIVSGAISSEYQRNKIEKTAEKIGLATISPLWGSNQENYLKYLVKSGFSFVIVSVAADGLNEDHIGKIICKENVDKLIKLSRKYRFNAAGEGGEFETIVLDAPIFSKEAKLWTRKKLENIFGKLEKL